MTHTWLRVDGRLDLSVVTKIPQCPFTLTHSSYLEVETSFKEVVSTVHNTSANVVARPETLGSGPLEIPFLVPAVVPGLCVAKVWVPFWLLWWSLLPEPGFGPR
jgi:hypothetical protein